MAEGVTSTEAPTSTSTPTTTSLPDPEGATSTAPEADQLVVESALEADSLLPAISLDRTAVWPGDVVTARLSVYNGSSAPLSGSVSLSYPNVEYGVRPGLYYLDGSVDGGELSYQNLWPFITVPSGQTWSATARLVMGNSSETAGLSIELSVHGTGTSVALATVDTLSGPPALPGAPAVTASVSGQTAWVGVSPPTTPGSSEITTYTVQYATSPAGPWIDLFVGQSSSISGGVNVPHGSPPAPSDGNLYRAAVATADGQGPFSDPVRARIPMECTVSLPVREGSQLGANCVENYLWSAGYRSSPGDVYLDAVSVEAIRQFQRSHGLPATGVADKPTLVEMGLWRDPPAATCTTSLTVRVGWGWGFSCMAQRMGQLGALAPWTATVSPWRDVYALQQAMGLPSTGFGDRTTLSALGIWREPPAPNCVVMVELGAPWMPGTACLERRLAQLGLFGRTPDDSSDWDTAVGVSYFQQSVALPNTARADWATLAFLGIWQSPPAASCSVAVGLGAAWMPGTACLERRLAQLGLFWKSPDEIFDWDTAVGVSLFQQSAGLPATSSPDRVTLERLGVWASAPPAPCVVSIFLGAPWMPGTACLERRLAQLGLFWRTPDDIFDWDTAVGVSLFRQSIGLPNSTTPDPLTLSYLGIWSAPPPRPCSVTRTQIRQSAGTLCLERRLAQIGLFRHAPDGAFTWETAVAVSFYQQSAGLANTASADVPTFSRLQILR